MNDKPCLELVYVRAGRAGDSMCGTPSGYTNRGCRGDNCRAAWAAACRSRSEGNRAFGKEAGTCAVGHCDRPVHAKALCRPDYMRWARNGRPPLLEYVASREAVGS